MQTEDFALTSEQEAAVHRAAWETVAAAAEDRPVRLSDPTLAGAGDRTVMGLFVTLHRNTHLRGCCGALGRPVPLRTALGTAGQRTTVDDHRFPRVSPSELTWLDLDVTILGNFQEVVEQGDDRLAAVEIGRHGLRIERRGQAGLLLPTVPVDHDWDVLTFLSQLCRKAGLPATAWREPDTVLVRFEGRRITGATDRRLFDAAAAVRPHPAATMLPSLRQFTAGSLHALLSGAVPECFPSDCADGTIDGLALRVRCAEDDAEEVFSRLQLRGGFPLQMTLLELTQSAADWIRRRPRHGDSDVQFEVDLAVFTDPACHGTIASPDLRGLDDQQRALLVIESRRNAWAFDRGTPAPDLLRSIATAADVRSPSAAGVYSVAVHSTASGLAAASRPQIRPGAAIRPPAVAGRFYPSDELALENLVDACLGDIPSEQQRWPAVMVPHAGLPYSGRIAAEVLKQVDIPDSVIVIGPRHTREGAEWAVAPHATWRIPGALVPADPELAVQLAQSIDGLERDAAAHAHEHAIEVELPFLAKLAPHARVTGIAFGRASLPQCQRFAEQLTQVLSELAEPPLLMISSDMNHFASDTDTRRLDELALSAMESRDPAALYDTVRSHGISMCGVLPAVIVMDVLRRQNRLSRVRRAGYATSGDVSGDRARVVGYAGMLLG